MYYNLKEPQQPVQWRKLMFNNVARPMTLFMLWMTCHNRLATKE